MNQYNTKQNLPPAAPWSYSKLKAFETCPFQYLKTKVLKEYVEKETDAMRYGNEFHKAAEDFLTPGNKAPLEERFKFAEKSLIALKQIDGDHLPEQKLGVTIKGSPCGFFEKKRVWYRGIADLIIIDGDTAHVFDHKTGSNTKYADPGQLELMAMSVFAHYPDVNTVKAALIFYVPKELIKRTYTRGKQSDILWLKWCEKFNRMRAAHEKGVFNPKPSGLCKRHCIVTECEHNGRNEV